jgi:hypothetical protein
VPPDPGITYKAASEWAAADNKQRALAGLRQAVELGFHDRPHIDADRNFERLRTTAEFRAIVERMQ